MLIDVLSFYLGYFSSSKSFNHITNDANVLHKLVKPHLGLFFLFFKSIFSFGSLSLVHTWVRTLNPKP
jgi:hypothetical protein